MRRFPMLLVLVLALGCGEGPSKDVLVPVEQVPEPVMKAARQELPDVTFDQARKKENGNYEIRGKDKQGKVREVEMSPAGKVVEKEE